ncbi:hypothetical protein GWK08_11905 [Leptobacterium flavescens]|uniref:Sodium:solute symporter family protein n=1 Tax=Leptobacterium flavescens TaxID=472055 RepID=A0A6P0UQP8_9FLAO|nr:sodium:solute symporter family protein [Leptobacterium flavescens]NER14149.1 hypothetical protein [Leptobacterium flavescens]
MSTLIVICISLYLLILISIGLIAHKKRQSNSMKDHYLAGGSLGAFVLLLTLYATQYSANTLLVTPAEVADKGLGMILILGYLTFIVISYLTFAPQLFRISKKRNFITPGDWFDYRFRLPSLSLIANFVLIIASLNFLLAQLMAMGHLVNGITDGQIPYRAGVIFLALVMIVYETLGGMRAVAWTDVAQGIMLFIGLGGLFFILLPDLEGLTNISKWLIKNEPQKINLPDPNFQIYWASTVLMIGLGAAVYPQAIQRIYAARSLKALKRSMSAMVFMPLFTVLILFLIGIVSIPHFTAIEKISHDAVLPYMLEYWGSQSLLGLILTLMVIIGLLAAIMSTADSVLLSLSSIISKDILGKTILKDVSEEQLTKTGKILSWIIIWVMVFFALNPKITLFRTIELKMQILIQTAPLFLLGVHSKKVTSKGMLIGLSIGFAFAVGTFFLGLKTIAGIQVGLIAFFLNVLGCYVFSYLFKN